MSDVIMVAINRLEKEVADVKVDVAQFRAGQDRVGERVANLEGVTSQLIERVGTIEREVADVRVEVRQLRETMERQGAELRQEMKSEVASLRQEMKSDVAEVRQELRHTVRLILTSWLSLAALILINILLYWLKGG